MCSGSARVVDAANRRPIPNALTRVPPLRLKIFDSREQPLSAATVRLVPSEEIARLNWHAESDGLVYHAKHYAALTDPHGSFSIELHHRQIRRRKPWSFCCRLYRCEPPPGTRTRRKFMR